MTNDPELKVLVGLDVSPSIDKIKSELDTKVKSALDGYLKISIDLDTNKLKDIEKQLTKFHEFLGKQNTVNFEDFTGADVSTKRISSVTAEKLKQTLAIREADAAEKLRGQTEQNNAKIEIQNSKLRVQLKKEEAQATKQVETEAKKSAQNQDSMKSVENGVKVLESRIAALKSTSSAILGDSNIMVELNRIEEGLKSVGGDRTKLKQLQSDFQVLGHNINEAGLRTKSFMDRVQETFSRLSSYMVNVAFFGFITKSIQDAIQSTLELNKAMNDLQVVTGWNNAQAKESVMLYNEYAKALGVSTKAIMEGADAWLRQGKSIEETNQAIQISTMFARIAQISTAEATELLTAALNGYKLEVKDAMGVVDMFNAVDMVAATSAKELGTAYQYVAASAGQAGISQEKLTALLAVGSEQTRLGAEQIGNTWRTLVTRMQNIKVGKFVDDETGENLNDVLKVLGKMDIEVVNSNGVWREFGDVLDEVGARWKTFDQTEQNAIATAMAGTRAANIYRATMENYGDVLEYTKTAQDSAGITMEKFGVITDSIDFKVNNFKESMVGMWQTIIDSEVVKGVIDSGTGIVKVLDSIAKTPVVGTLIGITTATVALGAAIKTVSAGQMGQAFLGFFKSIGIFRSCLTSSGSKLLSFATSDGEYSNTFLRAVA